MRSKATFWKTLIIGVAVIGLLSSCMSFPSERVSASRHPNLAEAQTFVQNAINKLSAAQMANEFDMNGHAGRAIQLLNQAYAEIKLAAEAANRQ